MYFEPISYFGQTKGKPPQLERLPFCLTPGDFILSLNGAAAKIQPDQFP
jgi:hypothetical protein